VSTALGNDPQTFSAIKASALTEIALVYRLPLWRGLAARILFIPAEERGEDIPAPERGHKPTQPDNPCTQKYIAQCGFPNLYLLCLLTAFFSRKDVKILFQG